MKDKKIVGVIGAGYWGKNHVKIFHDLNVLKAVAECSDQVRLAVTNEYPDVKVTAKYSELIHDNTLKGIVIATPAADHYKIAKDALVAGKDVLIEKPMVLNKDEAVDLIDTAKEKSKIIMVGHILLYNRAVQKLIELIESNVIGQVSFVDMRRAKLGKARKKENVLWSFAVHDLAVLLSFIRSPVKEIRAQGITALQNNIVDDAHLNIVFSSGVQAHLHASWLWPENERRTVVVGKKGMIVFEESRNRIIISRKGINKDFETWDQGEEEIVLPQNDALRGEAEHFLDCIKRRSNPRTDANSGLAVIDILIQADQVMRKSQPC